MLMAKAKKKAGRPKVLNGARTTSVNLDARRFEALHIIGSGNVSYGIRKVLDFYLDRSPIE